MSCVTASEEARHDIPGQRRPGQLPDTPIPILAQPVPATGFTVDGQELLSVESGHSDTDDTDDTTVRHVPSIGQAAELLATQPARGEFYAEMLRRYPGRVNPYTPWLSAARLLKD
jgi:hypothetical protein